MSSFDLVIPGRMYTKNTHSGRQGYGRKDGAYARAKEWELRARHHIEAHMMSRKERVPIFPKGTVVAFHLWVFVKKGVRADSQNYLKSACDALNKLVYYDDRQIEVCCARVITVDDTEKQRALIHVNQLIDERSDTLFDWSEMVRKKEI